VIDRQTDKWTDGRTTKTITIARRNIETGQLIIKNTLSAWFLIGNGTQQARILHFFLQSTQEIRRQACDFVCSA